jgi:Domain of unknown function (DUF4136)
MKRSVYLGLMVALLSGLSACTSYDYYTAAINKTNLSNYHTFAWMPPATTAGSKMNADMADAKIKDAATNALVMKGLQLSQRNPDLVVNYSTVVGTGTRTNYYSPYYGGYPGFGFGLGYRYGYGWGGYRGYYNAFGGPFSYYGGLTYAEKEQYKEGTLIIDLIDRRTRKIVWRGFGVGEVHSNPQKTIEDLPKVVDGVLAQLQLAPDQMRVRRS